MPYIIAEQREVVDAHIATIADNVVRLFDAHPGVLNYVITKLLVEVVARKGETYQTYNDIVGALECAKLEAYRRQIAVYENRKLMENGDVYPSEQRRMSCSHK